MISVIGVCVCRRVVLAPFLARAFSFSLFGNHALLRLPIISHSLARLNETCALTDCSEILVKMDENKSKKRGPYLQYLADEEVKIPKVTKWRNRTHRVQTDSEVSPLEENFVEEEILQDVDETLIPTTLEFVEHVSSIVDGEKEPEFHTTSSEFLQCDNDDPAINTGPSQIYDNYADDTDDEEFWEESNHSENDHVNSSGIYIPRLIFLLYTIFHR